MRAVGLSRMLRKKFRSYSSAMLIVLVCCFTSYLFMVNAVADDYDDGGGQPVEYKGKYLSFVFYDSDMMLRVLILTGAVLFFLVTAVLAFTLFYARNSVKPIYASLAYLESMTESIRSGKYDFPEFQETIMEFQQAEDAFRLMSESIRDQVERTRRSEDTRKRLMLDISHDLKNPLMSLAGYVELMASDGSGDHREQYLAIIAENVSRANQMVVDLFELAKMETLERQPAMAEVDVSEIVKSVIIERLDELRYNGVALRLSIQDGELPILGDEAALRRALTNILDNAIHYRKDGSTLYIGCEERDDAASLSFRNASALKQEGAGALLEPFARLGGSEGLNPQGSGLGLSIVRKIVEAHAGTVRLLTSEGGDFSVIIELPLLCEA